MEKRKRIDKGRFMMDDEYLDKMAQICGWQATLVYMSICRHTNKEQECFPSVNRMAIQHKVSRTTIFKGIAALKERGIIRVEKKKTLGGKWLNNTYTLLDKSGWDFSDQVHVIDLSSTLNGVVAKSISDTNPSPSDGLGVVHEIDAKETHGKETNNKETQSFLQNGVLRDGNFFGEDSNCLPLKEEKGKRKEMVDIFTQASAEPKLGSGPTPEKAKIKLNEVIKLFEPIFPGDFIGDRSALVKRTTRDAVEALLRRKTPDQIAELIWRFYMARDDQFRPRVGNVYEFCSSKLAKVEHYVSSTVQYAAGDWDSTKIVTQERIKEDEERERVLAAEIEEFLKNKNK